MDQRLFAPTHGLSQLIASFIASVSQGIRHAPFLTFSPHNCLTQNADCAENAQGHACGRACSSYFQLYSFNLEAGRHAAELHKLQSCLCQYVKDRCQGRTGNTPGKKTGRVPEDPRGEVENNGFEPLTPCLQSRCSSQLS